MSDARLDRAAVSGAPAAPGDEELLAGLAAGRLEALDALYDRYASMAYGIARRITGDDTLAEDVVQDAFLGAWRSADRYVAGRGCVKTWLLAIVHHRAIDVVRRRRPVSELPEEQEGARTPDKLIAPDSGARSPGASMPRRCGRRSRRSPSSSGRPWSSPTSAACRRPRSRSGRACRWGRSRAGSGWPVALRGELGLAVSPALEAADRRGAAMTTRPTLTCDEVRDLAPLFAVDALDADEMAAVREHLADCPDAHEELLAFGEAATAAARDGRARRAAARAQGAAAGRGRRRTWTRARTPRRARITASDAPVTPTPAAVPEAPVTAPVDLAAERARRRSRLGWLVAVAAVIGVIALGACERRAPAGPDRGTGLPAGRRPGARARDPARLRDRDPRQRGRVVVGARGDRRRRHDTDHGARPRADQRLARSTRRGRSKATRRPWPLGDLTVGADGARDRPRSRRRHRHPARSSR